MLVLRYLVAFGCNRITTYHYPSRKDVGINELKLSELLYDPRTPLMVYEYMYGVVEIEKDGVGLARVAARGDASMDGEARSARKGASFEGTDGLAERIVAGRLAVFAIEGVDEPVAETGREDGADLVAAGAEGEAYEGLTGGGGEGGGGSGVVEEEFGLGMHRLVSVVTDRGELKAVGVE